MSLHVTVSFPTSAATTAALAEDIKVRRVELREAMSALFELTLELLVRDPALDEHAIVGQPIEVTFGEQPFVTKVSGIVRQVQQTTAVVDGDSRYVWTIVPALWLCTQRVDHRIFQHMTVPEIVAAVVTGPAYAGRIQAPALLLGGEHSPREYCVQYGETDFAFLHRLLAEEGIAGFFDHANGSVWTLCDDTSSTGPTLETAIPFSEPSQLNPLLLRAPDAPHVSTIMIASKAITSTVTIRDYDFEKPDLLLEAGKAANGVASFAGEGVVESYFFEVGKFRHAQAGERRAETILHGARSERRLLTCHASFALPPGTAFTIVDHPRSDVNVEVLVVRATTVLEVEARASHVLECIERRFPYQPAHHPRPRIHGTHVATVVGAPGEEIDVDAHGRVEVQFKWDRRDLHRAGASRRVRVSQGWTGAGRGLVCLPRVGDEVVVAYHDGDPDEPMIIGTVHNATARTPLNLPAEKTLSVWRSSSSPGGGGYNQMLMDDAAGAERFEMHAQRDFTSNTGRNSVTTVGQDHSTKVVGNQMTRVESDQQTKVDGFQHYDVGDGSTQQAESYKFMTEKGWEVNAGTSLETHALTQNHEGQTSYATSSGGSSVTLLPDSIASTTKSYFVVGTDTIVLASGASSITMTPGGITIAAPVISINAEGNANLTGGTVDVHGSGAVDVKGTPIKLNC